MPAVLSFPAKMSARIDALEAAAQICDWHAKDCDDHAKWMKKVPINAAVYRATAARCREIARDIRELKGQPL